MAVSFDLMVTNTFFSKREEHTITYKSGNNAAQIDYIMYRRSNIREVKDCRVIPGDHVAPQHRLVRVRLQLTMPRPRKRIYEKRIKWTQLQEETKRLEFKTKVLERMDCDI